MLTGITTGGLFDILGVEGSFSMLKEAGFDAVDFSFDVFCRLWSVHNGARDDLFFKDEEELVEYFRPYKQAADKYGLMIHQAHAPFPSYFVNDDYTNAYALEAIKKSFPIISMMGCRYLVVHPGFANYENRLEPEEEKKVNMALYSALIPCCKKYSITVCLENMFTGNRGKIYEAICQNPDEANEYIDSLNALAGQKCFAFCYDAGHALLLGRDQYKTLKQLGHRVEILHVHDNNAVEDEHISPFMGKLDWGRFVKGLKAIGYNGVMNLEATNLYNRYPKELLFSIYRQAADTARYLAECVEA